jgi:hypothetical protein
VTLPPAPDKAELLRVLAAHGGRVDEVVGGLSAEEKAELGRLLSSWAGHLPVSPNGEGSSRAAAAR